MKGNVFKHQKGVFLEVLAVLLFLTGAISGISWAETYQYVAQWGNNPPDGMFFNPNGVAVDGSCNVYVADTF